jgi:hypothetical protein
MDYTFEWTFREYTEYRIYRIYMFPNVHKYNGLSRHQL